jgi:hypothetical protein
MTGAYLQFSNDLWKALYSGRYLALFQEFPHHSTFTYSPVEDFQYRNTYNWLGNLFFVGAFSLIGVPGLQIFRLFVLLFAAGLVWGLSDYQFSPLMLFVLVPFVFGIKQKLLLRTAIFAVPGMILLMWVWCRYELSTGSFYLWFIPVILLFWSNMHGSYLVGFGVFLLLIIGEVADRLILKRTVDYRWILKITVILLITVFAITFVKPFPDYKGLSMFGGVGNRILTAVGLDNPPTNPPDFSGKGKHNSTSTQRTITNPKSDQQKRLSLRSLRRKAVKSVKNLVRGFLFTDQSWRSGEFGFPLYAFSSLFVMMTLTLIPFSIGIFIVNVSKIRFSHVLPILGAMILGLGYLRTTAYFPLVAVPVGVLKYRLGHFEQLKFGRIPNIAASIGLIVLTANLGFRVYQGDVYRFFGSNSHRFSWGSATRFSENMPGYILRNYPDTRVLVHYNLSSFYIWNWWPYKKVFIDTKGSAYQDDFFAKYGENSPQKLAEMYDISLILMPISIPRNILQLIPQEDWAVVTFDEGTILYERVEKPKSINPIKKTLVTAEDYNKFPESLKRGFNVFIKVIYDFQNTADRQKNRNKKEVKGVEDRSAE